VPKYRRAIFANERIRESCKAVFEEIVPQYGCGLRAIEIMPDHVHLFIETKPTISLSTLFHRLKGRSAYILFRRCPEIKEKLWGGHLWSRGKFFRSVGEVTAETIKRYIEESQTKMRQKVPKPQRILDINSREGQTTLLDFAS
jgi:putative transposase